MQQRRFAALVLVAATTTLAACGSSDDADTAAASAVDADVAVGPAPAPVPGDGVGSLRDAMEVVAGAPGQAADAACTIDRQTLETAVEAYELLNGSRAASEQDLLDAQMIREASERFDVNADGAVIPAPGSPCP